MATVPCDRCGAPLDAIDITMFGDACKRYVAGEACDCPREHCPFCQTELAPDGRCRGPIDCVLFDHLVPVPDIHPPRPVPYVAGRIPDEAWVVSYR